MPAPPEPVLPDYGGACLSSLWPALAGVVGLDGAHPRGDGAVPAWLPEPVRRARQIVLFVLDGVGWSQIAEAGSALPSLSGAAGGPITSVAPTTTAAALTSITTGLSPGAHGVVGYRLAVDPPQEVDGDAADPHDGRRRDRREVLNVLQWRTERGDARRRYPPTRFVRAAAFGGEDVLVVSRREFAATGFSAAHLGRSRIAGWQVASTLVRGVADALGSGERFVYAYYDGLDKVAHEFGLGERYRDELVAADAIVGALAEVLPTGAVLLVVSDHGQVHIGKAAELPDPELLALSTLVSGEGRFRWFHVRDGALDDAVAAATEAHGGDAWVRTRQQILDERWFGDAPGPEVVARLGDVALVAHGATAFLDPADTGETVLQARHGSLTEAEMMVPLLALGGA